MMPRRAKAKAKLVRLPANGVTYVYKFSVAGVLYRGTTGYQDEPSAISFASALKEQVAAKRVVEAIGRGLVPNRKRDLPVIHVADEFWRQRASNDINAESVKGIIARVVRVIGPQTMMSEIDNFALNDFALAFREFRQPNGSPYEGSTINQYIRMLRRMHVYGGNRERGVLGLPLPSLDWASVWEPENERTREITPAEEAAMCSDGSDYATVLRFGIICGLRKTNLVKLMWHQVDFDRREITVDQKRSKSVKRKNRPHTIPMTSQMHDILRSQEPHKEAGHGQVWTLVSDRTGFNRKANRMFYRGLRTPMHVSGFDKWFRRRARKFGFDITIHDARRTTGGRVLSKTGSIAWTSKILGHSSPVITARIYARAVPDDLRIAMERASAPGTPSRCGRLPDEMMTHFDRPSP